MLLSAEQLSINFGSRQLLQDVDFYLNEGDKTGVIGINGTGKSTFLKVLAGLVQPDSGRISRRPNLQVSYLPQNPEMDDDRTILEQVFASMPPQFRALNEYEAKAMLTKLGLGETDRRIGTLSGGERRRAALCAALIHPADVLVLDEPTNHLDTEMVAWLEDWLRRYKGGLVMVTHDRYFLERVVNHITELSRGKLYHYEANYSRYLELREQRAQMAEASERKRQSILRVEREWILRGCQARSTKSKERIDRYEALKNQKAPECDSTVQLAAASSRLGKKIITLEHVSKGYDGRTLFADFSYGVLRTDRIGIVGRNGAGKSTLLRLLAGEIQPDSGTVELGETVRIGHFSQEGRELDLNQRVYDCIHEVAAGEDRRGDLLGQDDARALFVHARSAADDDRPSFGRRAAEAVSAVSPDGGAERAAARRADERSGRDDALHPRGLSAELPRPDHHGLARPFLPRQDGGHHSGGPAGGARRHLHRQLVRLGAQAPPGGGKEAGKVRKDRKTAAGAAAGEEAEVLV